MKYLRSLIDAYKDTNASNTETLELQLKKITKNYEELLKQKDIIIEKQDNQIKNLIKSKEELIKTNKTNSVGLKLQNEKYQEIIEKLTKTN